MLEKQGKLTAMTEWLLRHACRHFLQWRKMGFLPQLLGIPIVLQQLESISFIYHLSQMLQELHFSPEWLMLQVQDTPGYTQNDTQTENLEKSFRMLKYLGIKIALNNFDGGYFSLRCLKQFPVDYLKLDPYFVKDIVNSKDDSKEGSKESIAIIKSILFLAEHTTTTMIALGVDTQEQQHLLSKLGCILMEGDYFGTPMLEEEVLQKIQKITEVET